VAKPLAVWAAEKGKPVEEVLAKVREGRSIEGVLG
jgi:hypothetical protein